MTSPPEPPPSRRSPLEFDEMIAVAVAFAAIGTILWWGLGRGDRSPLPGFVSSADESAPTETFLGLPTDDEEEEARSPQPSPTVGVIVPTATPLPTGTPDRVAPTRTGAVVTGDAPAAATPSVADPIRPAIAFVDVPDNYWAAPFIAALSERGIVSGVSADRFDPDRPVNRAELSQLLQNAYDLPVDQNSLTFNDIPANYWATEAIQGVTGAGFMVGYPNNEFRPTQPVTRLETLVSLVSGLELPSPENAEQSLETYSDRDEIPDWAQNQIAVATEGGLVANDTNPNQLDPNSPATRAEVAVMIYQSLVESGQVEPIPSENLVNP